MKYTVIGPVARFSAGQKMRLTKEQAAARSHATTAVGGGVFELTREAEFKNGEILDLDVKPEALPRYLADTLQPHNGNGGKRPKPKGGLQSDDAAAGGEPEGEGA